MIPNGRWLKGRLLAVTLWIASFVLGIALITGTLGGTAAGATPSVHTPLSVVSNRSIGKMLPGVHRGLLQQRIGGTPMSSQ